MAKDLESTKRCTISSTFLLYIFIATVLGETRFRVIDRVGTWDESEVACQSIGMHLAVIQDEVTHEALHTYLSSLETLVTEFWIGLRWVTQNRDFVWLGGRKPVFFKWAPNEPNCFQNATSTIFVCAIEENCVIINVKEGWNTAQCLQPRNPICMTVFTEFVTTENTKFASLSSSIKTEYVENNFLIDGLNDDGIDINGRADKDPSITNQRTGEVMTSTIKFKPPETTTTKTNIGMSTDEDAFHKTISSSGSTEDKDNTTTSTTAKYKQVFPSTDELDISTPIQEEDFTDRLETSTNSVRVRSTVNTKQQDSFSSSWNNSRLCDCPCRHQNKNQSEENDNEAKTNLYKVEKKKTGSFLRSRTSAHDGRVSSTIIGCTGALVIVAVFFVVIFLDFNQVPCCKKKSDIETVQLNLGAKMSMPVK